MKYVIDYGESSLEISKEFEDSILMTVNNPDYSAQIFISKEDIFELIGVLHHLQKQIKNV